MLISRGSERAMGQAVFESVGAAGVVEVCAPAL
jgi:hypothetical protein